MMSYQGYLAQIEYSAEDRLSARRAYLESGGKLLTQDEILAEVNRRRCGDYHD